MTFPYPTNFKGLTEDDAHVLLWMALEKRGTDFVYQRQGGACVYFKEGEPSCLIGHVLAFLGFKSGEIEGNNARDVLERYFPETPHDLIEALNAAQTAQDNGETWGAAYEAFDKWLKDSKQPA